MKRRNGKKRWILVIGMIGTMLLSALSGAGGAAAATPFAFSGGKMSQDTLRAYCSRAVTLAGFCVENTQPDPIFEEDLRMIRRIGAKFVGRSAYYSWGGNMSYAQVEQHYRTAKERADRVHKADPEIILQAGVFEIIYKGTVNNTPIPAHVFEAFGLPVEKRNFRYDDMVYTSGKFAASNNYWGNDSSAVPNVTKTETQMYFYWQITRYIDAGYESVHLGQAELMASNDSRNFVHWDRITTLARTYAEVKGRRGLVLFDCHTAIDSGGMKIGNRLICDIQAAGIVPNETEYKDGAYQCEIADYHDCWLQWIGRSDGGEHPLGFTIEHNYTILEFDNYGGNGNPGVATKNAFYNWGYDDITWFAMQPKWYRDQFLRECQSFLTTHDLDSKGRQQYFLQPSCRRVLTDKPTLTYKIADIDNLDYVLNYLEEEKTAYTVDGTTLTLTVTKDYRANTPSDGCPNGFGQEDTIRELFLGKNTAENPAYTGCVIPGKTTAASGRQTTTKKPGSQTAKTSVRTNGTTGSAVSSAAAGAEPAVTESSGTETKPGETAPGGEEPTVTTAAESADTAQKSSSAAGLWIGGGIALLAAVGAGVWWIIRRRK